jgi:hypothetical protein
MPASRSTFARDDWVRIDHFGRLVMAPTQDDKRALRIAILRALQLADTQNNYLVAALLSQALDAAERDLPA